MGRDKNFVVGSLDATTTINGGPVTITDAATYQVLASNSGRLHVIPDMTQNTTIDLPREQNGLNFTFVYGGVAADAHDHTIDSEADANYFIGSVQFHDTDDDSTVDVPSDNNSNSKFTIANGYSGTKITLECDGTKWYINGIVLSDTTPAFADQ